jgi:hypothetical protein
MSRRIWWTVGIALAAVVALNLLLREIDSATQTPGGPRSSSYATAPHGLAAYAELLRRSGHPIRRLREPPAEAELDPATTVVVLDAEGLLESDSLALRRFVERGGRLVAGGSPEGFEPLAPAAPEWQLAGRSRYETLAPVPETAGVRSVAAAGEGSWRSGGGALPVVGAGDRTLLSVTQLGRGRVALLADASPLQNRLLSRADNAALGLALAGPRDRAVVFVESVHGYGETSGLAAIPERWLWTLGALAVATLVWMLARGRRLGPPERAQRELPPPRRDYAEALGLLLARTKSPGRAGAPLQAAVREQLVRRGLLARTAEPDAVRAAAKRAGLGDAEAAAVVTPVAHEEQLLAVGRALARLRRSSLGAS